MNHGKQLGRRHIHPGLFEEATHLESFQKIFDMLWREFVRAREAENLVGIVQEAHRNEQRDAQVDFCIVNARCAHIQFGEHRATACDRDKMIKQADVAKAFAFGKTRAWNVSTLARDRHQIRGTVIDTLVGCDFMSRLCTERPCGERTFCIAESSTDHNGVEEVLEECGSNGQHVSASAHQDRAAESGTCLGADTCQKGESDILWPAAQRHRNGKGRMKKWLAIRQASDVDELFFEICRHREAIARNRQIQGAACTSSKAGKQCGVEVYADEIIMKAGFLAALLGHGHQERAGKAHHQFRDPFGRQARAVA